MAAHQLNLYSSPALTMPFKDESMSGPNLHGTGHRKPYSTFSHCRPILSVYPFIKIRVLYKDRKLKRNVATLN